MFKSIIHNLIKTDMGFKECQAYNRLIANKPKGNFDLATKIKMQEEWTEDCRKALIKVREIL